MKIKKIFSLLLIAALLGGILMSTASCTPKEPVDQNDELIKDGSKILFFGDSITHAWRLGSKSTDKDYDPTIMGRSYERPHTTQIRACIKAEYPDCNLTFLNYGVGGDTFKLLYDRVQTDLIDQKPDVVFMLAGINEIWTQANNYDASFADGDKLFEAMTKGLPDTKFFIMEPFAIECGDSQTELYRTNAQEKKKVVKDLCAKYNLTFIEIDDYLNDFIASEGADPKTYTMDGIHPVDLGYDLIAEAFLDAAEIPYLNEAELLQKGITYYDENGK